MFRMEFETDNQAFEDSDVFEIRSILDQVSMKLLYGTYAGSIQDSNGNTVGKWAYTTEEERPS